MKKIILFFALITILFSSNFVLAQTNQFPGFGNYQFAYWPNIDYVLTILGIPGDVYGQNISNLIFRLIVPFIAIWAITLGFMRTLRIFRNSPGLETIISFAMAFATLPTGVFVAFVGALLAFSGVWATMFFFGMFIVGIVLYSNTWFWGNYEINRLGKEERTLRQKMKKIDEQLRNPSTTPDLAHELMDERDTIEYQLKDIERRINQMSAQNKLRHEEGIV